MKIIKGKRNFDLHTFLQKPLFAHLATLEGDIPKDSPVWFHWEDGCLWIIGTGADTFPKRINKNPKCAVGIIDFNVESGKVLHAGFRGTGSVEPFNKEMANRLLIRYLGPEEAEWDPRFRNLDKDDGNVLIRIVPETVVVRDQSYVPAKNT